MKQKKQVEAFKLEDLSKEELLFILRGMLVRIPQGEIAWLRYDIAREKASRAYSEYDRLIKKCDQLKLGSKRYSEMRIRRETVWKRYCRLRKQSDKYFHLWESLSNDPG